jgi:cytochrome c oxidase assembly protein subunit 11
MSRSLSGPVLKRSLLVALASFVFCFSLVPLYRIACEVVFGIKLEQGGSGEAQAAAYGIDPSRLITVEFDAGVNSQLPWSFQPELASTKVHPGQPMDAMYFARNLGDETIVGNAVPSVAPSTASQYFIKTECFCFTEQLLAAGEQRPMPVRFVIDPALPADISTVTLSYTFYNNELASARVAAADARAARAAP